MKRQTTTILCSLAVLLLAVLVSVPFSKAQVAPTQPLVCTGSWSAGPNLPSPAVRAVGVFFPANGKFYAMGGRSADTAGSEFTHPFEYDPVGNSWTTKSATYPDNQVNNMACGVLTDAGTPYIYCVGGSAATQTTATGRVFRYDPVTDAITTVASPWPGAAGTTLPGGFTVFQNKLYILGGFNIPAGSATNQIWEFTPGTNAWVLKVAVLPAPRGYIPTTTIGSLIYTGGGSIISGGVITDGTDSFVYNPVADTIGTIASIPRATGETRALNFMGQMWVMGGGRTAPNPSNEVDIYDPAAGTWTTGVPFITARRNFPTDTDGSSRVWLAGGYASDQITPLSSMEIFQCTATPTPTATRTPTPTNTPTNTPAVTATPTPKPVIIPPLVDFRDVRNTHTVGPDLCGTGHASINFTGSTGSAGDTWITVYDTTPGNPDEGPLFGSVILSADVQIRRFNNRKGAGLLALFNEAPSDKGLALIIYDNGNTDGLTLGTVSKSSGQVGLLTNVFLDSGIAECDWYRLTMDVVVSGGNVTVTGKVFRHTVPSDPNSPVDGQVGGTLSFTGPLPAGVGTTGEVGIVASAISAVVDSSVTNFTIDP
jgi:N-acetylneuraminic acid mutarotase